MDGLTNAFLARAVSAIIIVIADAICDDEERFWVRIIIRAIAFAVFSWVLVRFGGMPK